MSQSKRPVHIEGIRLTEVLGHLKTYDDQVTLDRAWSRIARSNVVGVPSPSAHRPGARMLSSAVLVAAGVLMGIYLERSFAGAHEFSVQSESSVHQSYLPSSEGTRPDAPLEDRVGTDGARPEKYSVRALTHGEQLRARSHKRSLNSQRIASAVVPDSGEPQAAVEVPVVFVPQQATWLALAERGDFAGAFQELEKSGGFDQALLAAGPDELMTLVDVARAVGRQGQAIQALRIVIDQYRDDENAPLAAMMLGNLLSRTGDASGAAEAFALNRRLSPDGDFAQDALVREFDMAITAMDLAEAERLRAQYESEYPDGRHKEALRADLDRLVQELVPAGDGSPADDVALEEQAEEREPEHEKERSADSAPAESIAPVLPTRPAP